MHIYFNALVRKDVRRVAMIEMPVREQHRARTAPRFAQLAFYPRRFRTRVYYDRVRTRVVIYDITICFQKSDGKHYDFYHTLLLLNTLLTAGSCCNLLTSRSISFMLLTFTPIVSVAISFLSTRPFIE